MRQDSNLRPLRPESWNSQVTNPYLIDLLKIKTLQINVFMECLVSHYKRRNISTFWTEKKEVHVRYNIFLQAIF